MISSADIRKTFIDYFSKHEHEVVPSSPLVPANDPTLLFTNAGMVQFKDVFIGQDKRPYTRAVSSQRCVRAGGKHNDLENVGYTARHHTFFEMLGNFSFGDYFKREAIQYSWEFLTDVMKLPPEKLWITVYEDDGEAADIWLNEIKINPDCLSRIGDKPGKKYESDNFWSMGDTGPCGPCTEIFYDHGAEIEGGPPGTPEEDGDRYIEIWNLVFMQYNRDSEGTLTPLPKPSVDTGMGLERLAAILQGVHSNYEIDLFQNLIRAASSVTSCKDLENKSLRVIADHIRACSFLIVDGILPSNEGRGYVLRRIIRRAIRHGYQLGQQDPFFFQLVDTLVTEMGDAYPELAKQKDQVKKILRLEEERFAETLEQGLKILRNDIAHLQGKVISGQTAFQLYDTYGFPVDLTADIAREHNLTVDMDGFEKSMNEQRERARSASQFGVDYNNKIDIEGTTDFTGYEHTQDQAQIIGLFRDGEPVEQLQRGLGIVVLDKTPFYAESGGQAGDTGSIKCRSAEFKVQDTHKQGGGVFVHIGEVTNGVLNKGDPVNASVDLGRRQAIALNHSATHLMHAALQTVLGGHVAQKGSLVNAERLRFDFSHFGPMTQGEIRDVETLVNDQIRLNSEVKTKVMDYDSAVASGAMALFGEKYGDSVRVLKIGGFSTELCGGTHAKRAGDIGVFKVVSETGVAAGVRRVEAVTGVKVLEYIDQQEESLQQIMGLVKGSKDNVQEKVRQVMERNRLLEKSWSN